MQILLITIQISLLILIMLAVAIYRAITKPIRTIIRDEDLGFFLDRNKNDRPTT